MNLYFYVPTQPQTLHVSGAHNSPVACLEWSPDGELLYTGDALGTVFVTVTNFQKVMIIRYFKVKSVEQSNLVNLSWPLLRVSKLVL